MVFQKGPGGGGGPGDRRGGLGLLPAGGSVTGSQGGPGAGEEAAKEEVAKKPYQFLMVDILREYLALEFQVGFRQAEVGRV